MADVRMKITLAYITGFEMARAGDPLGNPYADDSLTFWWRSGYEDCALGRPRLFEQEMAALGLDAPSKGL